MAEPQFVSAGAYLDGSADNAAVAVPAGTSAGRVVLVTMFMDGAALAVPPTPAAGFVPAEGSPVQIPSGGGSHSLYIWWKRLTAADAGTYTFTWSGSRYREAVATLWQNVTPDGDPFDSPTDTATDVGNSTVTPPVDVTTAGPDRLLVWSGTCWAGGTWTAPTGHTKRVQGGAGLFTVTDRSWPTASATGDVTGTCTGSDKRLAWLGALIGTTAASTHGTVSAPLPALTAVLDGDVTASATVDGLLPALDGAVTAGATATGTVGAALPPLTADMAGKAGIGGVLAAATPALTGSINASASSGAVVDASLPSLTGELVALVGTSGGHLNADLPALAGTFTAAATISAATAPVLPSLAAILDGTSTVRGALVGTIPAATATLQGEAVAPAAVLNGTLPPLTAALQGVSDGTAPPLLILRVGTPRLGWPVATTSTRWPVGPPGLGE